MEYRLGIDVGSTTVKLVLLDETGTIVYSRYERHMSNVFEKAGELIQDFKDSMGDISVRPVITGSGGLSLADLLGIRFEQEVITCSRAVEELIPQTVPSPDHLFKHWFQSNEIHLVFLLYSIKLQIFFAALRYSLRPLFSLS